MFTYNFDGKKGAKTQKISQGEMHLKRVFFGNFYYSKQGETCVHSDSQGQIGETRAHQSSDRFYPVSPSSTAPPIAIFIPFGGPLSKYAS